MSSPVPTRHVTRLLLDWRGGNQAALDELLPLVYDVLRRLAQARLRQEPHGHTLQATALVHEAYVRLVDLDQLTSGTGTTSSRWRRVSCGRYWWITHVASDWTNAVAAPPRLRSAASVAAPSLDVDVLDLDNALEELAALDDRLARVVELKFFVGMTLDETADALQVSHATVERDWAMAKAWLVCRLAGRAAQV